MTNARKLYKVSLTFNQINLLYNLLSREHDILFEESKNHPDLETMEFAMWALEWGEGTYVSTFGDYLETMEEESEQLE